MLDATHDPALRSWVASANRPGSDFPIQNLPYGRFRRAGSGEAWRIGVAIGDEVLDLARAATAVDWPTGVIAALGPLAAGDLASFMDQGPSAWRALRAAVSRALAEGSAQQRALRDCIVPQRDCEYTLPCTIGDYTDFYTGIHHATSVGRQFRPDNPLLPNYKWVPIGYHGRSSSIVPSGHPVRRPRGQVKGAQAEVPSYGPTQRLDYELELGLLIAGGNALGESIPMERAEAHLFGFTIFNDWSARDVQAWEYQPLGPFLSKNFCSTLSPWVVTLEALAPYRVPFSRPEGDPDPLPYLDSQANRAQGSFDMVLEVWLQTKAMREAGLAAVRLSQSNFREAAYWTPAQLVAHHTANGCNLRSGDLFGTGTLAGPKEGQGGSLLELSVGGKQPVALPGGETRSFLEDGDTLAIRAYCERDGLPRIGLGECVGTIVP